MAKPKVSIQRDLKQRWTTLELKKGDLLAQSERNAGWTLPYVFKPAGTPGTAELDVPPDPIGAECVNHLSNKVVSTLFPDRTSFMRLTLDAKAKREIEAELAEEAADIEEVRAQVAKLIGELEIELAQSEKEAMDYLDMVGFRPQAVQASKLLVITGNALEFHPKGKPTQVYSIRDYCVVRDLSGIVIEIMTKESKAFETFHPAVQDQLRSLGKVQNKSYDDKTEITIYTQIRLEDDGKFHLYQAGDTVKLDTEDAVWPRDKLPWIVLTWNLIRGEDYGRGLVAEYAGAFHSINVMTAAVMNIAAILGDIKFLVNPASGIDIETLNKSPPGSYHLGKEGDITQVKFEGGVQNAQFLLGMIERSEQQLKRAFLLGVRRQAERVTAEEIRSDANELETSNGGIYSRLASTWQVPLSGILLDAIDFKGVGQGITPKVITGMDSLSRISELDNLRMFMADLGMLQAVPEDMRAVFKPDQFAAVIGTNRQVEYRKFIKSPAEIQADIDRAQQQQAQQVAQEQQGAVAVEAGKAAMKQPA